MEKCNSVTLPNTQYYFIQPRGSRNFRKWDFLFLFSSVNKSFFLLLYFKSSCRFKWILFKGVEIHTMRCTIKVIYLLQDPIYFPQFIAPKGHFRKIEPNKEKDTDLKLDTDTWSVAIICIHLSRGKVTYITQQKEFLTDTNYKRNKCSIQLIYLIYPHCLYVLLLYPSIY